MKKKRHKCCEHHPSGELQNRFTLLTHTITTRKNQALSLPEGGPALKLTDGLQLKRIFSSFQSASSNKYKMKIDTFLRFSKDLVRHACWGKTRLSIQGFSTCSSRSFSKSKSCVDVRADPPSKSEGSARHRANPLSKTRRLVHIRS